MQIQGSANIHNAQAISAPHRAQAPQPAAPSSQVKGADQLDISHEADIASRVRDLPEIRTERVAQIRAAIAEGTYETDEKLDIALDRLFEEIGG